MQIELNKIGKRYNREWVFKDLNHIFSEKTSTAVIGSNGSGKSTLIKILSAAELPSSGELFISTSEKVNVPLNEAYSHINISAPYIDLPEQLSTLELIKFHLSFKSFIGSLSIDEFLKLIFLEDSKDKLIKNFSSGMKQRLKLGLSICTKSSILLLDEPCSNLDQKGIAMYHLLMEKFNQNRTIIIGSNEQETELFNVQKTINIMDFKPIN